MDAYAALLDRGISPATLRYFGVTLTRRYGLPYWEYPVRDADGGIISWRHKRACQHANAPKYGWSTEKSPARADALYGVGLVEEGKELHICAGEPDVWLMTSLGRRACTFLAGEGTLPEAAIRQLLDRKPRHAIVLYDHDETGHRGAVKLVRRLRDLGLKAGAKRLPEEVGPGGDVTDLFRLCDRDKARFLATLRALPYLEIPKPVRDEVQPVGPRRLHVPVGSSPIERFKVEHPIAEVVEAAGVRLRPRQGGRYLDGRCPFHPDRTPSFWVCPETGHWGCFSCDIIGDVIDFVRLSEGVRGTDAVAV